MLPVSYMTQEFYRSRTAGVSMGAAVLIHCV